ncbi:MAG: hypothetical protein C4527_22545 [Candidatus Omnitrophota bacterium]|nr:MAG: hypothetical protein C4527_22545 [Candidatus Omnitrophota bacterium]
MEIVFHLLEFVLIGCLRMGLKMRDAFLQRFSMLFQFLACFVRNNRFFLIFQILFEFFNGIEKFVCGFCKILFQFMVALVG